MTVTKRKSEEGSVIVAALILFLVATALVASYLSLSSNDVRLTKITIDQERAFIAAEAGLDYGVMKLRDLINQYKLSPNVPQNVLQAMIDAIPTPPNIDEFAYVTPGGQSAFRILIESPIVSGIITNGTSCRGSMGDYQYFSITSGCINTNSGRGVVVKQMVQAVGLCLIRFGVFYGDDLEILPGPTMSFFGPVHSNGDMYLGGPLNFNDRVTSHGDIYHRRKNNDDRPGEAKVVNKDGELVSMIDDGEYIDSDTDGWMATALQQWDGNLLTSDHGTVELNPPINPLDDAHDIIERATPTNDPSYNVDTESEKFENKSCLTINVDSNGVVTAHDYYTNDVTARITNATLQISGTNSSSGKPEYAKDSEGRYEMTTNGAIDTSQQNFYDGREDAQMAPVDIYVDELISEFPELHDGSFGENEGRGIIYITRDDPDGATNGVIPCVRLRNGNTIDAPQGISIVSDLPVYIEGNYNTNNTKSSLVAGDAVTLLSSDWQDAQSTLSLNDRVPDDTTYRTVIMTGNEETTTGDYNGGLENVLRFLEKWSGKTVDFRGSIIDLWYSETATADWSYGDYYTAPFRDWGYDEVYRSQAPPGMTRVFGMEEISWTRTTWGEEGW